MQATDRNALPTSEAGYRSHPWIMRQVSGLALCGALLSGCAPEPGAVRHLEIELEPSLEGGITLTFDDGGTASFRGSRAGWPIRGPHVARLGKEHLELLDAVVPRGPVDFEPEPSHHRIGWNEVSWVREGAARQSVRFRTEELPRDLTVALLGAEAVAKRLSWIPEGPHATAEPHVPDIYRFVYSREDPQTSRENLPFVRIELERPKYWDGDRSPEFEILLGSDGRATWVGSSNIERLGKHTAELDLRDFGRICWFVDKYDVTSLAAEYPISNSIHADTVILRLVRPDGQVVEFEDHGFQAPIEVFLLRTMIESLTLTLDWTEVK